MKAFELMNALYALRKSEAENTVDCIKAGNENCEVHRVAVSMFATPDVIHAASNWGAQLLIVHEPTYYNHRDDRDPENVVAEMKRRLLEQSGLALYRFHDYAHRMIPDLIYEGEKQWLGLDGAETVSEFGKRRIVLDTPITPREMALRIQEKLHIAHPRICGTLDKPITTVSCCFGTPAMLFEELRSPTSELVLTGEACEWALGEYARDADQLGITKSLIIMGHIGSERDGMQLLATRIPTMFPVEAQYFECGEVYSYAETLRK